MQTESDFRYEAMNQFETPFLPGDAKLGNSLTSIPEIIATLRAFEEDSEPNTILNSELVTVACRIALKRNNGKIVFSTVRSLERGGHTLQVMLVPQHIDPDRVVAFKSGVHIGDILYVTGVIGYSGTKELTLFATEWTMAAKCLNEMPKPAKNPETGTLEHVLNKATIHDQPVLHLLTSPAHRDNIVRRAALMRAVRNFMDERGYLEVETPVLSSHAGGASAAKFTVHSNARDMDMYLRIATELYLKRLVIGGMGNVFEMGKNFRNEGIDSTHSPEFTSLEAYTLHSDYRDQAEFTRDLITAAWLGFSGNPMETCDMVSFYGSLGQALDRSGQPSLTAESTLDEVLEVYRGLGLEPAQGASRDRLVEDLFDGVVLPTLRGAVFVMDFPTGTTPLAYPNGDGTSQKWDLYIDGMEVATAYTENNDPLVQAETLTEDQDFVHDVKYGMPPMGGLGIGIDRLAMLLCGVPHINDVNHHPHSSV